MPDAPTIPGLRFRHFQGGSDYAALAAVLSASQTADGIQRKVTAENLAEAFKHGLVNCDPYSDMILAEVAGELVGYGRGWWEEEDSSLRLYKHNAFLVPAWRRQGIGSAMLRWLENRLAGLAQTHPPECQKFLQANVLQTNVSQFQTGATTLLEGAGYQPVRYFYLMVRPDMEAIAEHPLPPGLEIRPVVPAHYPLIWEFTVKISQEEWSPTPATQEAYQEWLNHPHFQPHLWQVAWDQATDQVVGTVLTYINYQENQQMGLQRGYTEGIGVAPQWRRRGVARALIAQSLQAQVAAGMAESALVADSQSAFEITSLYESCGFQIVDRDTIYRKAMLV